MIPKLDSFRVLEAGISSINIGKPSTLRIAQNPHDLDTAQTTAIDLLQQLIETPSFSE
jgi:hypothetical protein